MRVVDFGSWPVINFNAIGSNENVSSKIQFKISFFSSTKSLHRPSGNRKHHPQPHRSVISLGVQQSMEENMSPCQKSRGSHQEETAWGRNSSFFYPQPLLPCPLPQDRSLPSICSPISDQNNSNHKMWLGRETSLLVLKKYKFWQL